MAQRENHLDREKLCCSVCLDLLKDPVTLPCGHSYCMNCIKSCWDEEDQKQRNSIPECKQSFTPRPALVRNTVIAGLVEDTEKTGLQAASSGVPGLGDVTCDFCTERKLKAIKSCLQCVVSYCEQHLQPHYEVAAFKKHKLVDPSQELQEIICSRHSEVMKIFCRTDQQCICYLCSMDEHKGHETVSAEAAMSEKQRELRESQQNMERKIKEKEEIVKVLQQEISELRRRKAELEQLSHTEDPTQFLHSYTSLSPLGEATDSPSIDVHPQRYTEDVTAAASEDVLSKEWTLTSLSGIKGGPWGLQKEPKTRAEFLKYKCQITFNSNTAQRCVAFEHDLKAKYNYSQGIRYHHHPGRFTDWPQVLCREDLTVPSYWEVEWSGNVFIAVAYKNISRSGGGSAFGNSDSSWALECYHGGYEFRHYGSSTFIKGPESSRIGVYLDYSSLHGANILSFYSVSESTRTVTLLHRGSVGRSLLFGLGVYDFGSFAEICEVLS